MGSAVILKVVTLLMWLLSAGATETSRRSRKSSGDQILPRSYLHMPGMLHFRNPLLPPEHFAPSRGTGSEPLPPRVRDLLLPVTPTPDPPAAALEPGGIHTHCDGDKMTVKVHTSALGSGGSASHLSLGTCRPTGSRPTGEFINLEIRFNQCRTVRKVINNQIVYSNTLIYDPPAPLGQIRTVIPFTWPVSCQYDRYHYSYKIGYIPKMETQGVFIPMTSREDIILTPRNARWERLAPWEHYVLGKPMFFEVVARSLAPGRQLYAQSCHATLGPSATSTPRLSIVDNFGCMGKEIGRSRFIPSSKNRVRFIVDAFLLDATVQPMYMHCSMSTADSTVTPTAKACNYDSASARWKEVSGLESVCFCCETSCSSAPSSDMMVRSRSWTVERRGKPSAHAKKNIYTTAATTMTPTTVRMMTKFRTSQQDAAAVSPVNVYAPKWEWPEKVLRGSSVDGQVLKDSGGVKEVLKGSGGVKEVRKQSGGVKGVLKGSGGVKEVRKGSGGVKGVLKGSGGVKEVRKGSGGVKGVLKGSGGVKGVLKDSGGVKEVRKGSGGVKGVLKGSGGVKGVLKGSGGVKGVLKGSGGVKGVLKGSGGVKEVRKGSGGVKGVLKGSGGVKGVLKGSGGVKGVLKGSGGVKEVRKGSGGVKEVRKQSGGVKEVLKGSGGVKGVLKDSGGVKGVRKQSGGVKEVRKQSGVKEVLKGPKTVREGLKGPETVRDGLKGPETVRNGLKGPETVRNGLKVLKGPETVRENLKGPETVRDGLKGPETVRNGLKGPKTVREGLKGPETVRNGLKGPKTVREGLKGPETVRDGLKGPEVVLNVFSGEKDAVKGSGVAGKVMKGSEGVEDVLERFGVEPHRIFETFFGLDK